jgi:hypothetical protein
MEAFQFPLSLFEYCAISEYESISNLLLIYLWKTKKLKKSLSVESMGVYFYLSFVNRRIFRLVVQQGSSRAHPELWTQPSEVCNLNTVLKAGQISNLSIRMYICTWKQVPWREISENVLTHLPMEISECHFTYNHSEISRKIREGTKFVQFRLESPTLWLLIEYTSHYTTVVSSQIKFLSFEFQEESADTNVPCLQLNFLNIWWKLSRLGGGGCRHPCPRVFT